MIPEKMNKGTLTKRRKRPMVTGIVLVSVERSMINDVIDGLMKLQGVTASFL